MTTHIITVGKDPDRKRIVVKSATDSDFDTALAKAVADMLPTALNAHERCQRILSELDAQAAAWQAKADAQTSSVSELRKFYRGKAADARRLAKDIRDGKYS